MSDALIPLRMTPARRARLEEIRLRLEAATPGDWSVWGSDSGMPQIKSTFDGGTDVAWVDDEDDAAFIANAREDIADLLELLGMDLV